MLPNPGEVWTFPRHHQDPDTGEWKTKHILILAVDAKYELIVYRPFTSQSVGRSLNPACSHGPPTSLHPAYNVGVGVLPVLPLQSWVDLNFQDDFEEDYWDLLVARNILTHVGQLQIGLFCAILMCASQAGVKDTTYQQVDFIKDTRSLIGCT